jgi:hypothetical protein
MPGNPREIVQHAAPTGWCYCPAVGATIPVEPFRDFRVALAKPARRHANPYPHGKAPLGHCDDAVSIYLLDATLASAFVARWCAASKVETKGGLFRIRDDEPPPRIGAGLHRTP